MRQQHIIWKNKGESFFFTLYQFIYKFIIFQQKCWKSHLVTVKDWHQVHQVGLKRIMHSVSTQEHIQQTLERIQQVNKYLQNIYVCQFYELDINRMSILREDIFCLGRKMAYR